MVHLIPLLALQTSPLPAGYYSLRSLAAELSKKGLAVEVSPECADECYAVRLSEWTVPNLTSALRATGRLTVEDKGGTLSIRRSTTDRDEDRTLLDRYLTAILTPIVSVRSDAVRKITEVLRASGQPPESETAELAARISTGSPETEELARLISSFSSSAIVYPQLAVPVKLGSEGRRSIGRLFRFRVSESPNLFFPPGLQDKLPPFSTVAHLAGGAPDAALGKLVMDPVSGCTVFRFVYGYSDPTQGFGLRYEPVVLRRAKLGPPPLDSVFGKEAWASLAKRVARTEIECARGSGGKPVKLRPGKLRLSEALLRLSERSGQDLLAYVSPLSDRILSVGSEESMLGILTKANRGEFDVDSEQTAIAERTGIMDPPGRSAGWPTVSGAMVGGTLVVRSEADFLDLLIDGPTLLPDEIGPAALRDQLPSARSVLTHVADLKLSQWSGSLFSTRYLTYTNPTSLYPFAKLAVASPFVMQALADVERKGAIEIAVAGLKAEERREFLTGIERASDRCDLAERTFEPARVAQLGANGRLNNSVIRVTRSADRYLFQLVALNGNGVGRTVWESWLANVRMGNGD